MRVLSKPSTAKCDLNLYMLFLLAEPKYVSCTRLEQLLEDLSHDSVNRFLLRERYTPADLFTLVSPHITLSGGTLSGDDSVIDKPYSDPSKTELIDFYWSGKHKKTVKGINIISLYYTDINGISMPVNYRLNDKKDGKTKHDYFREMIQEVVLWGLCPLYITADSWYASVDTLNYLKNEDYRGLFAVEPNRLVSLDGAPYSHVSKLDIPDDGLVVHLKKVGTVKVFRTVFKNDYRYYIMFVPRPNEGESLDELEAFEAIDEQCFKTVHAHHWGIEQYHRALKQVCNIERFHVRDTAAIGTHIFGALCAFVELEIKRATGIIHNWYALRRHLFDDVIRSFVIDEIAEVVKRQPA
ncbi:MAG: transposase [Cyanobacteria bacterium P01_F01_bin.150]